jgi:hypothetical protein
LKYTEDKRAVHHIAALTAHGFLPPYSEIERAWEINTILFSLHQSLKETGLAVSYESDEKVQLTNFVQL